MDPEPSVAELEMEKAMSAQATTVEVTVIELFDVSRSVSFSVTVAVIGNGPDTEVLRETVRAWVVRYGRSGGVQVTVPGPA